MLNLTFRALRHPNYRLYFFGQVVSLTGTWVQMAALIWLAYALTGQSRWPALVSAAQVLPTLFLGVWGGSLADRWPRRPLIVATQWAMLLLALALAGMVALSAVTPWGLFAVALLIGVVNAIDTPARLVFVMDLVGREDVVNAVALNSMVFNVARTAGPSLTGWLLPWLGPAACFLFNALSFLGLLAALLAMDLPSAPAPDTNRPRPGAVLDGFAHLARRPALVQLVVLAGAMAFFGWPLLALLPAVSVGQFAAGEKGYARMLSAVGAGALVGALLVATFASTGRRPFFLALGVAIGAAALVGLASSSTLALGVVCCAASGCGLILFFATGQATMQLGADEHNRGRVMGIWLMVLSAAQPAGNLVAGWAADAWGVRTVLHLQGAGIAAAGAAVLAFALYRTLSR